VHLRDARPPPAQDHQLDLLALTNPESTQALPEEVRQEARDALRMLLIEVIVAERGEESGDEQDQR
jgi:hypothetical protein